jgi:hypothetical protein
MDIESTVRFVADGCVTYRKVIRNEDAKIAEKSGYAERVGS